MADASKGITADGGPKTVGAFLTSWLETSVRGSVRKMHETLHKALRQAMRWGYMMKNPADDVDPPKVPRKKLPRSPVKRRVGY